MPTAKAPEPLTLTKTAAFLRMAILFAGFAIITLMVGRMFFTALIGYLKTINPPPPPPPTVGFQQLPAITYPPEDTRPDQYRLETVGGRTPVISDRSKVFFIPTAQPSLKAVERATAKANALGYKGTPQIIDSRTYRWTNTSPLLSTLEMDILTLTFSITTNWVSHPELLVQSNQLNANTLVNRLKSYLTTAGSLPADLTAGSSTTQFVKALGGQLEPVNAIADADFLEINLYRSLIDEEFGSISTEGKKGPINAVMAADGTILELTAKVYPVEYEIVETYPLRDTAEAWQAFTQGQGFLAERGTEQEAVVRSITMAYLEPHSEQSYYRPVYVFEGDGGFLGFIDALDQTWVK